MIHAWICQHADHGCAEPSQPLDLGVDLLPTRLECRRPVSDLDIQMQPIFDNLGLGDRLEPDPRPDPVRVDDGVGAFTFVAGIGPALTFARARS